MLVILLIIGTGKTIKSNAPSQYGWATRHKDVFQCVVGALCFCLLEFLSTNMPDWRVNKEWFDIKVLAEQCKDTTKEMT
jgi:hypothetical protein